MKRHLLPALCAILALSSCKKGKDLSQEATPNNKALVWTKTYGGTGYDFAQAVVQTSNGYVLAGTTRSTDGDIAGGRVGYDTWLAKVDTAGNKVWSTAYGTSDDEHTTGMVQTADGGFMVIGYTFINNRNLAWALKADASGNRQWQKQLTISIDARPLAIVATGDGNYLISGYEAGEDKDRNGWLVKVDGNGDKQWSKLMGGSGEDQFTSIAKTNDGFIVSGQTASNNNDISTNKGGVDGWVVKIDAAGNKQWSNTYGGSNEDLLKSIIRTTDGHYVVTGYTKSSNGDVTGYKGGYDQWIMKLNESGNKVWGKTFGGINEEYITTVINTPDGGYITVGHTNSTTGDVLRKDNDFGGWLLKLDAGGNKVTTSTYGETRHDDAISSIIATTDGGYLIVGYTFIDGRGYDGWLVKTDKL